MVIAVNTNGKASLIADGGVTDTLFSIGFDTNQKFMFYVIKGAGEKFFFFKKDLNLGQSKKWTFKKIWKSEVFLSPK